MNNKLLVLGTIAYDSIETPNIKTGKILGGCATYIGLAASMFKTNCCIVSIVGEDFEKSISCYCPMCEKEYGWLTVAFRFEPPACNTFYAFNDVKVTCSNCNFSYDANVFYAWYFLVINFVN